MWGRCGHVHNMYSETSHYSSYKNKDSNTQECGVISTRQRQMLHNLPLWKDICLHWFSLYRKVWVAFLWGRDCFHSPVCGERGLVKKNNLISFSQTQSSIQGGKQCIKIQIMRTDLLVQTTSTLVFQSSLAYIGYVLYWLAPFWCYIPLQPLSSPIRLERYNGSSAVELQSVTLCC